MARKIPGNARPTVAYYFGPDAFAIQAASLGHMTNTFSPASTGVHSAGATARGYAGLPGYGVNRFDNDLGPMQGFHGAIQPIRDPKSRRLGADWGPSGQPGLPQTGYDAQGLAYIGIGELSGLGMGA